ncbi:Rnase H [Caulobacter phage CcrSC]|uniref:Uncharacterized protein n=1 Tax=Caulobacter phage CcrSC TaxID=2283272 RepID=A0A385EG71_9CAUD|nr:Rnase H [Caulobacter phage CcrSC]AXQ69942.1 hypothetical protein CcrSC_gp360 [Caulobacter phage CcrSC]
MRYYLDCEFDGHGGALLSMALYRKDARALYMVRDDAEQIANNAWVCEHVLPVLRKSPSNIGIETIPITEFGPTLAKFFEGEQPFIVADWPADIIHFCQQLMIQPDKMAAVPNFVTQVIRIPDAYADTPFKSAVRHNAMWDAIVLCDAIEP